MDEIVDILYILFSVFLGAPIVVKAGVKAGLILRRIFDALYDFFDWLLN